MNYSRLEKINRTSQVEEGELFQAMSRQVLENVERVTVLTKIDGEVYNSTERVNLSSGRHHGWAKGARFEATEKKGKPSKKREKEDSP